ncbi:hypothetical protein FRC17_009644 [Serendipita sp. 399]|nr:hypothetical protein FRC17_009644 [Serendipita sp. 399]
MVGTYGRTKSTLGNNTYSNYIVTGVSTDVSGWGVPPTAVYGVTSVYTNSDRTEGYIPITITMTTGNGYSHIKGTSLRITTPITTVQLTSSTSTVTSTPVSSGPSTISAGALVGGLIGGVALGVALGVLLGLGLLFYLMKKKEERARADRQRVDEGAVPVMNPFAANDRAVHPEVQVPYAEEAPKVEETSPGPTQYARATQSSYSVSFYTTISVNPAEYGGATTLKYDWTYEAWCGSRKTPPGTNLAMSSSVGDVVYRENLASANSSTLLVNNQGWDYPPFRYSGEVNLATNADRTLGYIPLAINITFPREVGDYINYFVRKAMITITTDSTPIPSTISSTTTGTPTLPPSSDSKRLPVGAFVGGIIGSAVLVAIVAFAFAFFWIKNHKRRMAVDSGYSPGLVEGDTTGPKPPGMEQAPLPVAPYIIGSGSGMNSNNANGMGYPASPYTDMRGTGSYTSATQMGPSPPPIYATPIPFQR